jgi:hypothetical protein
MITTPSGAQFEISVDGKPRSYRDMKIAAPFFRGRLAKLKYDGGRPLRP